MMAAFFGRDEEISQLMDLTRKKNASLITLQGRRRIGKSTLIRHFCTLQNKPCFEFQGLPPRPGQSKHDQLAAFAVTLAKYLGLKQGKFADWTEAFAHLDLLCLKNDGTKTKYVILLDEISWMGVREPDFAGYLKDAWDRLFSQHSNLILVLCGSVSSWIQKNILQSTAFVGRVSREFVLKELSMSESFKMLQSSLKKMTPREAAQILSVTGGVPKYLEEFSPYKLVDVAIRELCFRQNGFLFREFEAIFSDIFGKKNKLYAKILKEIIIKPISPSALALKIGHPLNGEWSDIIDELALAGFVRRDFSWSFKGQPTKSSQLRVSDSYARFYLKYIEPQKHKITKLSSAADGGGIPINWASTMGLQFETLLLNNLKSLVTLAQIPMHDIVQIGPYFQTSTKSKAGVQIDCLVQGKKGLLHIFEFKSGNKIGIEVEKEVMRKSSLLKIPRGFSMRHYLVYSGELSEDLCESEYFDRKISIDDFIQSK
jgi:hypothetical protein